MTEWIEKKISELGTVVGGATPSTKDEQNYIDGSIPWITPKDLAGFRGRYISRGERSITQKGLASCSAQMMPKHSVLFTSRAPIGYVAISANPVCTNQGFKSVVPNENTDYLFLYYLLKFYKDKIEALGSGTTFKEVSGTTMKNIVVRVPKEKEKQREIGLILSSIDDKIEVNEKINHNLQQQASELFDAWFISFVRSDGKMPADWHKGTLGDIAAITSGKRPPMKQAVASVDATIPLVGAASIMGFTNAILYNEPILVTGRVGTHGVVQRFQSPCWTSDNTLVIKSDFYEYTFQVLQCVDYVNMNRGSTQPLITQTDLKNVSIVIPTEEVLLEYEKIAGSLMAMYESNRKENERLSTLRDTLLPKRPIHFHILAVKTAQTA